MPLYVHKESALRIYHIMMDDAIGNLCTSHMFKFQLKRNSVFRLVEI